MELFKEFISQALIPALALAFTGFITWLGVKLKGVFEKSDKEKLYLSLASTCVQAVEQIYKDLDGKAKLEKALEAFSQMLKTRGIKLSPIEMRMYIEDAVGAFNDVFNKDKGEDKQPPVVADFTPADADTKEPPAEEQAEG